MANGKGLLPRPGLPPFLQRIRPGRPELPADWAELSEDGIRERLASMGYSDRMIETEIQRYREYQAKVFTPRPKVVDMSEPKPKSGVMGALDDALKGRPKGG